MGYQKTVPDRERLVKEVVNNDYVGLTQRPNYHTEAAWIKESAPLSIAYKEAREISYWLRLLKYTDYFTEKEFESIHADAEELCRIIGSIQKTPKVNS
jgi:hypothetical protein